MACHRRRKARSLYELLQAFAEERVSPGSWPGAADTNRFSGLLQYTVRPDF